MVKIVRNTTFQLTALDAELEASQREILGRTVRDATFNGDVRVVRKLRCEHTPKRVVASQSKVILGLLTAKDKLLTHSKRSTSTAQEDPMLPGRLEYCLVRLHLQDFEQEASQ